MSTPIIVAHRGLHHEHPENSLAAFAAAWEAGLEWCECDVRGSSDDVPFVIHDETLDRTTRGRGRVDAASSDQLGRLVPTFQQLIESMPSNARLLVEIKPGVSPRTVAATMELCNGRCVVQSFDPRILTAAAEIRSGIDLKLLVEDARGPIARQAGPWSGINTAFKTMHPRIVETLHARKLAVGVWTVNSQADIERILALGVDTIISDEPQCVAQLAGKRLAAGAKIG